MERFNIQISRLYQVTLHSIYIYPMHITFLHSYHKMHTCIKHYTRVCIYVCLHIYMHVWLCAYYYICIWIYTTYIHDPLTIFTYINIISMTFYIYIYIWNREYVYVERATKNCFYSNKGWKAIVFLYFVLHKSRYWLNCWYFLWGTCIKYWNSKKITSVIRLFFSTLAKLVARCCFNQRTTSYHR